jgi:hypothetical protein
MKEIKEIDTYYENQKVFCKQNNLPMFASSKCDHRYDWIRDDRYGKLQTFGEMLVEKYGEKEAFIVSSSSHIISCPACCRSWCD